MGGEVLYADDDFSVPENVQKVVRPNRWVHIKSGETSVFIANWVVFLGASLFLWAFAIGCMVDPTGSYATYKYAQSWITLNFTWFYIGTNDVWAVFICYLWFSKYGDQKLGKQDEKPQFSDWSWFCMMFTCGVAIGMYTWGVSEPMYYYRAGYGNKLFKTPMMNDDDRAQQAIFITLFHWGLHAYVVYSLVAITLGVVAFRKGLPMTFKIAFEPLLGKHVHGLCGDIIDILAIACTTFGVCTSLGMGVGTISAGFARIIPGWVDSTSMQILIIWVITIIAFCSVALGLTRGIQNLSFIAFTLGMMLVLCVLFFDNTWYLMNAYVQSLGHYFQYLIGVGFECDAWEQLNYEFVGGASNKLWGSNGFYGGETFLSALNSSVVNGVAVFQTYVPDESFPVCGSEGENVVSLDPNSLFGSHAMQFVDWWTVFYWGWWISWAPFVGTFIAKISRGRTIRQVINGSFFASCAYVFFWLVVFGAAGIRMERAAELALGMEVDWVEGKVDCSNHYWTGSEPSGLWDPSSEVSPVLGACSLCGVLSDTGVNLLNLETPESESVYGQSKVMAIDIASVEDVEGASMTLSAKMAICYADAALNDGMLTTSQGVLTGVPVVPEYIVMLPSANKTECATNSSHCGGMPMSDKAIGLANDLGMYALACRPHSGRTYDLLDQYFPQFPGIRTFLYLLTVVGLIIYFITSSDSGSMVDDINSAGGLTDPPILTKFYWAMTEGATATALLYSGGSQALSALQAASTVAGFPWTLALCFMCTSCLRAVKEGAGELNNVMWFNTCLFDFMEGFRPPPLPDYLNYTELPSVAVRAQSLVVAIFAPFVSVMNITKKIDGDKMSPRAIALTVSVAACWIVFICLQISAMAVTVAYSYIGFIVPWVLMIAVVNILRVEVREKWGIYGNYAEDFFASMIMWPMVLSQMELHVTMVARKDPAYGPAKGVELSVVETQQNAL